MFEGFTLEQQRMIEIGRGWKTTYSALTYCTAEAVVMRNFSAGNISDTEVIIATRTSGAPDCLGKIQSKWGGYVKPTDPTPLHSMRRVLQETFEWNSEQFDLKLAGIIGPWLYKSTLASDGEQFVLTVSDVQAEKTPFQATLFCATVSNNCELGQGSYLKSTTGARWIKIGDLVQSEGNNCDHLYWLMIFECLRVISSSSPIDVLAVMAGQQPGCYSIAA